MAMQALVMGFGGTGAQTLTYLKEIAVLKHGESPPGIKFLLFDTIADWQPGETVSILGGSAEEQLAKGHEEGTSLDPDSEYYYLQDHHPFLDEHVFKLLDRRVGQPEKLPHFKDWLHIQWLGRHIAKDKLNIKEGAAQQRQIGRFAMFQNASRIIPRMTQELRNLKIGEMNVNVWIIGSAAGGTGAGTMLDAAYMARIAAQGIGIQITGVIVLPDVYADKEGISRARAYSLFRELDRFQEVGMGKKSNHQYVVDGTLASSDVIYDANRSHHARIESKLFDNLFYIGSECRNNDARETFFSSVANALDPYLDETQGRDLLQGSVNDVGFAASSFGAARLYVPIETYKALFAWEEVKDYLEAITAPQKERDNENIIRNAYFGAKGEREEGAKTKITAVLHLFENLLEWAPRKEEELISYAENALTPETIVTRWYQTSGGGSIAGTNIKGAEQKKILWTYINPYLSLTEANEANLTDQDKEVKSFRENQKSKGPKESQEESRDRFARELDQITQRYTRTDGGQGSFAAGAKQIFDTVSGMLHNRIDEQLIDELQRKASAIGWDTDNREDGTAMTRLYQELVWIIADNGPLNAISQVLNVLIDRLNSQENFRKDQAVNMTNTLRDSRKSGLNPFSVWVENHQQDAREECSNYIRWYQKRGLLGDMQQLVAAVKARYQQWHDVFRNLLEGVAIRRTEELPALYKVQQEYNRLGGRLNRLARNGSALISCQPNRPGGDRDVNMQGYRYELKRRVVGEGYQSLAHEALANSRWQMAVSERGNIQVSLEIIWHEETLTLSKPTELRNLHTALYQRFRRVIDAGLEDHDIFDYLSYVREEHNTPWDDVVRMLNNAATVLINTRAQAVSRLVHKKAVIANKQDMSDALQTALRKIDAHAQDPADLYSDPNALTLLKVCKPQPGDVFEVDQCRDEYLKEQIDSETGDFNHDETLYRAQVYHPFRAELEAWYIERHYARSQGQILTKEDHIPHRLVRLLAHPDMMRAFVYCVATGVVEKIEKDDGELWVFHNSEVGQDLELTTEHEPTADVVRAAVIFVLQQREAKPSSMEQITYDHAMESAKHKAQQTIDQKRQAALMEGEETTEQKTKDDIVAEFVNGSALDEFLNKHFGDSGVTQGAAGTHPKAEIHKLEKQALKRIFQFYGTRKRRTILEDRMELP
jgi:hypothetical protein